MIVVTGIIEVGEGSREELMKHAGEMARITRTEAGCHAYAFFQDIEDGNRFRIYEEWEDEASLAAHFETEHMAKWREANKGFEITSIHIVKFEAGEVTRIR